MKTKTAKATSRRKTSAKTTPTTKPDAYEAAARWCSYTLGILHQLYEDASRVAHVLNDPKHPFCQHLDGRYIADLLNGLNSAESAAITMMPCPPCPIHLPDFLDGFEGSDK